MMIEYRKAVAGDAVILTQLRMDMLCEEACHPDDLKEKLRSNTMAYMLSGLADGSFSAWLAEDAERIVAAGGAAYFTLPPNDWCPGGSTAYVGNMYTWPEYRGRGIATKLLSLIMEEAKGKGCERIVLNATAAGRPIYEKYGFIDWPDAMVYLPNGWPDTHS
jgi:GNAT superfamily N-acetyltransferase